MMVGGPAPGSACDRLGFGDQKRTRSETPFASRVKCGDNGAPGCPTSTRTLISQTIWQLRRPPFQAQCVNQPGPCLRLATSNDVLRALSVDGDRVVRWRGFVDRDEARRAVGLAE